jgi:benzoyl-CoA 2,3-dioxygenase component B
VEKEVPALVSLNERLRDDFITDSLRGVTRWNRVLERNSVPFRLQLPHKAFNRRIGSFANVRIAPDGRVISEAEWAAKVRQWLPTEDDRAFVASLMGRVAEPGKFANWIAPPANGIKGQPVNFEYVRFN